MTDVVFSPRWVRGVVSLFALACVGWVQADETPAAKPTQVDAGAREAITSRGAPAASTAKNAAETPAERSARLLRQAFAKLQQREFVQMVSAIAKGSQMGPGDGWFHPSQSRYDWKWLAGRFDLDRNGKIALSELQGREALFRKLDRDGDGALTPADFDWSDRSSLQRQSALASQLFRMLDRDSNGRISPKEWDELFVKASKGKNHLTAEDLRAALQPPAPASGKAASGPSPLILMLGLLNGELGSFREGPALNAAAPDFTLKTHDGKHEVTLSKLYRQKPVCLIFGSFT